MVWTNTCSADFYKEFAKQYGREEQGYTGVIQRQSSLAEFAKT